MIGEFGICNPDNEAHLRLIFNHICMELPKSTSTINIYHKMSLEISNKEVFFYNQSLSSSAAIGILNKHHMLKKNHLSCDCLSTYHEEFLDRFLVSRQLIFVQDDILKRLLDSALSSRCRMILEEFLKTTKTFKLLYLLRMLPE